VPELIAKGPDASQRWRRPLVEASPVHLGRAPTAGWSVAWDPQISREHVELIWKDGRLEVRCLDSARNPVFYRGQSLSRFSLGIGEHFVIGSTSFHVADDVADVSLSSPEPREEHTFRPGDLRRIQFRNADHRLEVLSQLPQLIGESTSDEMLSVRLVSLLLAGIPDAEAVALVRRVDPQTETDRAVQVLQWDRRREAEGRFQPSQRLILEAVGRDESVLHVWSDTSSTVQTFTVTENLDWAFCTPVPGEACRGWALYVAGSSNLVQTANVAAGDPITSERKGDLRFAELVAELLGSLRQVRRLEGQRAELRQFFSPTVLEALSGENAEEKLAPRESDYTVLFCDLRGFSKETEQYRDKLVELLERVSGALGVMTDQILKYGGSIGNYQGDAAMGFWGWPLPAQDDPLSACLAALDIRAEFQRAANQPGHPLADFRVGIGIATGRAVAGKIGTADHAKVTVFGPVANLASRLEGMTKQMRVPILLDEATAEFVRANLPPSRGRVRRLGRVRPYGLESSLMISELLPPAADDSTLSDQNVADFDAAVDALHAGRWSEALELLHKVPAKDRAKDFLTIFIVQNNYEPPQKWDGVIPMPSK
jgi:adenylate cyclase